MKKYILILALLCINNLSNAQDTDSCSSITYTGVVKVDSATSKEELYDRARLWFVNTFKDSKKVLEISDKQTGELAGKGSMPYRSSVFMSSGATVGWINFTIKITVKDGRYKYEISDFNHEANPGNEHPWSLGMVTIGYCEAGKRGPMGWWKKVRKEMLGMIEVKQEYIVKSLTKGMNVPSAKNDNW